MKVKPTPKRGRVVVEVDRKDEQLLSRGAAEGGGAASSFSLRKILVPIDFSDCSRKALAYAVPLAKQFAARITLLNVMPANYFVGSEFGPVDFPVPEGEWRENTSRELDLLAQKTVGNAVPFAVSVRQGQPAYEIASCAKEIDADLIVLSTHGRTGLRHVLVGSVAENVVRYAPCPVLVVREEEHEFLRRATESES